MKYISYLIFCFISIGLSSQSNCDTKCFGSSKYLPSPLHFPFSAVKDWEIDNINMFLTPLIMDVLNNDGIPEIIVGNPNIFTISPILSDGITLVDSKTKSIIRSVKTAYYRIGGTGTYLVADINNDCKKEIIIASSESTLNPEHLRRRLVCYDLDGNILWISDDIYGKNLAPLEQLIGLGGALGLADFNQDGIADVYIYNEIFNATNGVKLCDGGLNGNGKSSTSGGGASQSMSVAANFDDDPQLELAAGYSIYKVNISNPDGQVGNTMNALNNDIGRLADGFTSVADLNEDGTLDVIVSGGGYFNLFPPINIDLYGYTLKNNTTSLLFTTDTDSPYKGAVMIDKTQIQLILKCITWYLATTWIL
jgi:hypothetical protein